MHLTSIDYRSAWYYDWQCVLASDMIRLFVLPLITERLLQIQVCPPVNFYGYHLLILMQTLTTTGS